MPLNGSQDTVFVQCKKMILWGERRKKEQCFQCSVSFASAAQLETLLKGHQDLKVTDLEGPGSNLLFVRGSAQPLPFQGLKTASVMSRENQFHRNQAEMWPKVVHLRAGATQQSLLLGDPGTFQKEGMGSLGLQKPPGFFQDTGSL